MNVQKFRGLLKHLEISQKSCTFAENYVYLAYNGVQEFGKTWLRNNFTPSHSAVNIMIRRKVQA